MGQRAQLKAASLAQEVPEVLHVKNADDVFGRFLVNGNARVLVLDDAADNLVQCGAGGKRHDLVARNHDLPNRHVVEVDHPVQHGFLRLQQLSPAAAAADDQLEFL